MKFGYLVAVIIAIYGFGSLIVMMNLESKILQKQIVIDNQTKTIEYLTVKYLVTPEEQKLIKEANKLLKERNNAK